MSGKPTPFYTKDGKRVPGVTTVLGNLGWNKNVLMAWQRKMFLQGIDPQAVSQQALSVGGYVHAMIEAELMGTGFPSPQGLDNVAQMKAGNAFTAFQAWRKLNGLQVLHMEHSMVSEKFRFGARIDLIALLNERPTVLDFKVAKAVYVDHRVQVAAERMLYHENTGVYPDGMVLRLGKEEPEVEPFALGQQSLEWLLFRYLLAVHELRPLVE